MVSFILVHNAIVGQTTVDFAPLKDGTIFEGNSTGSNGVGSLFSGRTNGTSGTSNRRALIKFDISSIPANSVVTSVTFSITGSRGNNQTFNLHRLTKNWGEASTDGTGNGGGQADPGQTNDATWNSNFLNISNWTTPGGDFIGASSANGTIGSGSTTDFSSATLTSDVQGWINGTFDNHGWILIGNEGSQGSAVRMNSSEEGSPPNLSITYSCPVMLTLTGDIVSGTYNASQNITASGTIGNSASVFFEAGTDIVLDSNFEIDNGGSLSADLIGCD